MILSFAGKHRKKIAGTFLLMIYLELATPLLVHANSSEWHGPRSYPDGYGDYRANRLVDFRTGSELRNQSLNVEKQETLVSNSKHEKTMIGGPGQPEMSSFQSVNGNNLVDLFTGDFSYNIPLMDVGGYPVNIHYSSGITMDQESSWVGLGWNINPGTISRNMRGLPDDFDGTDSITKTQNIRINKTTGVKVTGSWEFAGKPLNVGLGAGLGVFHNTYNGWGTEQMINVSLSVAKKSAGEQNSGDSVTTSAGLGINNNSQSGLSASPSLNVRLKKVDADNQRFTNMGLSTNYHSRAGLSSLTVDASKLKLTEKTRTSAFPNLSGSISFAQPSFTPTITMPTTSSNVSFQFKGGGEFFANHPNLAITGYVNMQEIAEQDRIQKKPAYGYLYFSAGENNINALLDFNREKELQFTYKSTPNIGIPQYTYDIYSVSGEGTGGTIRPYRGDAGSIRDHFMATKSKDQNITAEIGIASFFHGGFTYDHIRSTTENSRWTRNNSIGSKVAFQKSDSLYESVYFRNPSEKTTNAASYYQQIGDDTLMRVKLNKSNKENVVAMSSYELFKNLNKTGELQVNSAIYKKERDKRSQVITYLTADQATNYGLNTNIISYKENTIPFGPCQDTVEIIKRIDDSIHKKNHLSEIDVLNPDGRRYVYGIPAYNVRQRDVTFSVDKETNSANIDSGLVAYSPVDASVQNNKGKEAYFNKEEIPAYAHSFLLTGILSPDYVDVNNDGITEDDPGDAIKFNYSRIFGPQQGHYAWRTPGSVGKANYNEGLKSYKRDDKGTFLFGEKEVWYLHSVESKTMVALFKVSDRKDAFAAAGEYGGFNSSKSLRKLDSIELYAKSDLVKNGTSARPIKTVHFEYTYELVPGNPANSGEAVTGNEAKGKLTLKKIWFTYNKNDKGKLNPYSFVYHNNNPSYHPKKYDRWGNYKTGSTNPGGLNNADFPYSVQDSATAALNAAAWTLTGIKLPSGGRMNITYESDDYGYVQNRRAMQMFSIAGFGNSATATPKEFLYGGSDNEYLFVDANVTVNSTNDVFKKFLEGNDWLYFKIAVNMPSDIWGSGFELVPVYGKIESYGKVASQNRFWIKFEKVQGFSPMVRAAMQFLRNNLPSKAYPSSEIGNNVGIKDMLGTLVSSFTEIANSVSGFENASKGKGWCKSVALPSSFIRLNSPTYKKLGGGLRVKRVEIFDNWKTMTNQRESVYGQEYQYNTSINVDGTSKVISSGVASYEPMIGNEENPFRQPIAFAEKIAPLAPVSYLYSEMPLGESYYPGASVGYSKVRVRTINAKAKSANGWQETEYFTTKDFPTLVAYTIIDENSKARYKPPIQNFLRVNAKDRVTVSQGFKIELNDMNGKVKSTAIYAETDSLHAIASTRNFYKLENDRAATPKLSNSVWVVDSLNGHVNKNGIVGKDIELITDFRQQVSNTYSVGIAPNIDAFPIGVFPAIWPNLYRLPQFDESAFRSVATVKIVQRYGILDSVVVKDKGSVVSTKNLLYDGETGEVVLSRTQNEFNDPIFNFSYPAHWAYSGMGMAYKNVNAQFTNLIAKKGKLFYKSSEYAPFPADKYFESGDELWVSGISRTTLPNEVCNEFFINIFTPSPKLPRRLWAIEAGKGTDNDHGIYLIDGNGKPVSGIIDSLKILRSGKRNLLDASVGNIVSMVNPIKEVSTGNFRLMIDSSLKPVNAAVTTYKDIWKVDNSYYEVDSCYTKTDTVTLSNLSSTGSMLMRDYSKNANSQAIAPSANILNDPHFTASLHNFRNCSHTIEINCRRNRTYRTKSIIKFNLAEVPETANIISATLALRDVQIKGIWQNNDQDNLSWSAYTNANYARGGNLGGRTNAAVLKNVKSSWNLYTPFNGIVTGAATVNIPSASDESCSASPDSFDVKSLIAESILSPSNSYGMLIQLANDAHADKAEELRTRSFCTGLNYSGSGISTEVPGHGGGGCNMCFLPKLSITYSYSKDTCVKICRKNINDTMVNPYRWGILGNWRMDRAYTYYHDRSESDASSDQTDIRKDGLLKSFSAYWKFTDTVLQPNGDPAKWVWNSAISNYNTKGFETENFDPLGRYNSGLYGYKQTLPVAVAQNSKYREILFDGFEDYSFQTSNCTTCDNKREFDFVTGQSGVIIDGTESHTGKNSVKVNAGSYAQLSIPVEAVADSAAQVSVKVDSTAIYETSVVGVGTGLVGTYEGSTIVSGNCTTTPFSQNRTDANIDFVWGGASPISGMCFMKPLPPFNVGFADYGVAWTGKIQARTTGYHRFHLDFAGWANISVTRTTDNKMVNLRAPVTGKKNSTDTIYLEAGKLYNISIQYMKRRNINSYIRLGWSADQVMSEQIISQNFLYPSTITSSDTVGSVVRNISRYCVALNNVAPKKVIRKTLSLLPGTKMIVGAWVKMQGADCNTAAALGDVVTGSYVGSAETFSLQKTGVRIEGWQRYEAVVDIPANATKLNIRLNGAGGRIVFVDDVRLQPYNSNMKTYVYDPVSLRLMADLDENNYAAFYEYDDDGTLVRVKKETEKGIMTIKETRSALFKDE